MYDKLKASTLVLLVLAGMTAGNALAGQVSAGMTADNAVDGQDEWDFTIGTGLFGLHIDGDTGFHTQQWGPVEVDTTMNFNELTDVLETAYGFGGSASKGDWTIVLSFDHMELEDTESGTTVNNGPASVRINFKATVAELAGIKSLAQTNGHNWGALIGLRYIDHDYDAKATVANITASTSRGDDWTDVILGVTHAMPLSDTVVWNNQFDVGLGDSDGTYHFNTGVNWMFADSWSADFYVDYVQHDFENGSPGDTDWYLYDAAEYGLGVNIMYHF